MCKCRHQGLFRFPRLPPQNNVNVGNRDAAIPPQSSVSCQPRWPLLRKAPYVAEFIPVFRPRIGGNRSFRDNQFAVSFIDSVKHFGITHWRNFSQRCYLHQAAATTESTISYTRHTVRQYQFSQFAAIIESGIPDARNAVWYDTVFASCNQCVSFRLNYWIAIIAGVVATVSTLYCNLSQTAAICESTIPYDLHAVGQCQFGQAAATPESTISDALQAVRQCQFSQAAAIKVFTTDYYSIFYR